MRAFVFASLVVMGGAALAQTQGGSAAESATKAGLPAFCGQPDLSAARRGLCDSELLSKPLIELEGSMKSASARLSTLPEGSSAYDDLKKNVDGFLLDPESECADRSDQCLSTALRNRINEVERVVNEAVIQAQRREAEINASRIAAERAAALAAENERAAIQAKHEAEVAAAVNDRTRMLLVGFAAVVVILAGVFGYAWTRNRRSASLLQAARPVPVAPMAPTAPPAMPEAVMAAEVAAAQSAASGTAPAVTPQASGGFWDFRTIGIAVSIGISLLILAVVHSGSEGGSTTGAAFWILIIGAMAVVSAWLWAMFLASYDKRLDDHSPHMKVVMYLTGGAAYPIFLLDALRVAGLTGDVELRDKLVINLMLMGVGWCMAIGGAIFV